MRNDDSTTTGTERAPQAPATCPLCNSHTADFQELPIWTAEQVGSQIGSGQITYKYSDMQIHSYRVCKRHQIDHSRLRWGMLLFAPLVVANIALIVIWTVASRYVDVGVVAPIYVGLNALVSMACLLSLVASPVFCILYVVNSPLRKLKRLALEERKQRTTAGMIAAFTEQERLR
jgi:hypothetical protein